MLSAVATPATVGTADRLTCCTQTLQGLQYIASTQIVHRDVAARNVLLDATMTCKVRALWRRFRALPSMLPCVCPVAIAQ